MELSDRSNGRSSSSKEKHLIAVPVAGGSSGIGLPYAPEDWPNPGDKWRWKVGNRKSNMGHWVDRYLYPPPSCPKYNGCKPGFPSRISVEQYIRKEFPEMDVDVFFSSFIWKVPYADQTPQKAMEKYLATYSPSCSLNVTLLTGSGLATGPGFAPGPGVCKAGNAMCSSQAKLKTEALTAKDCDICCSEAGFCRDCCCILCCRIVDLAHGGYSFIRCEATLDDNYICGHVAHLECALRSYMAGTVGGSIGLDVEYYCRRCDNRTDLMSRVNKLLKVCESLDSREDVEKILNLGFCILRGSEKTRAKKLRDHIGLVIAKLKRGVHLDEVWKVDDTIATPIAGDLSNARNEIVVLGAVDITSKKGKFDDANEVEPLQKIEAADGRTRRPLYITSDHNSIVAKLEDEIDHVLEQLKISEQMEHRIAEEKLYAQKDFLLSLYRQLDYERSELANPTSTPSVGDCDALLSNVLHRVDQIKYEEEKLTKMMKIANGFGRTPKTILAEYFGLSADD